MLLLCAGGYYFLVYLPEEENKKAQKEKEGLTKKYDEQEQRIKELENKKDEAEKNSKNPNLTEDERIFWSNKAKQFSGEAENLRTNNKSILDRIKDLGKQIKDNNNVISGNLSNLDDKHWIWDFLTLENIAIAFAIYFLWKLTRDKE